MNSVRVNNEPALVSSDLEEMFASGRALLHQDSTGYYFDQVVEVVHHVKSRLENTQRVFSAVSPEQLAATVNHVDLEQPLGSLTEALAELDELYLRDTVYFHLPDYAAHLNCPVAIPALAAEVMVSSLNTSMDTWDQSGGATLIERKLIDWTTDRLGLASTADGIFTSGGTQSNLHALLLAREHVLRHRQGVNRDQLHVFCSADSHFSVHRACFLLGLAEENVIAIPTDANHRLSIPHLERTIHETRAHGGIPMAIIGTAGTTDFGAIDPLGALARIARASSAWLHVDAAYGGGLLTSLKYRHLLEGIEFADSVTVDFHKTYFQPISSSALLVRNRAQLQSLAHYADYLNPRESSTENPNQVDKSLQTTRRFDALKLWLTLRLMGADMIGGFLDGLIELRHRLHARMSADPRFEVIPAGALTTIVFRLFQEGATGEEVDELNRQARRRLQASGTGMIAATKVNGRVYCKLTLLNPEASMEQLLALLDRFADGITPTEAAHKEKEVTR